MRTSVWKLGGVVLAVALTACTAHRPVLYPNEQLLRVGQQAAARDVDDCVRRAEAYVSTGGSRTRAAGDVATDTAVGAGTGAAVGAVGGAVTGNAGTGAAVGAATGATAGLLHGIFGAFRTREPDHVYANFVERCLRERGYDPIGWE